MDTVLFFRKRTPMIDAIWATLVNSHPAYLQLKESDKGPEQGCRWPGLRLHLPESRRANSG